MPLPETLGAGGGNQDSRLNATDIDIRREVSGKEQGGQTGRPVSHVEELGLHSKGFGIS